MMFEILISINILASIVLLMVSIHKCTNIIKILTKPKVITNKIPWVIYGAIPPRDGFDPVAELGDLFINTETLDCYMYRLSVDKEKKWCKIGYTIMKYHGLRRNKPKKGKKNPQIVKIVKEKRGKKK